MPAKFNVNVTGERTGLQWHGDFEVKTSLSFRDDLRKDTFRRELLGGVNPQHADVRAVNLADIFSELWVRIVSAPTWWTEKGNGIDLEDENVVATVYNLTMEEEKKANAELKKKAEAAREALRKDSSAAG